MSAFFARAAAIASVPIAVLGAPSTAIGLVLDVALLAFVASWPRAMGLHRA